MDRTEALNSLVFRETHPILVVVNGSEAHGTAVEGTSDFDLFGVSVPSIDHYFGLSNFGSKGTMEIRDGDLDAVMYEATKAVRLLGKSNPNLTMMLFGREEDILFCNAAGRILLDNRERFLSKKIANTFCGYAKKAVAKMRAPDGPTGKMGEKRKASVERFGYDVKDACHLIRILRMGEEILLTGEVNVWRGNIDAGELIFIKTGGWSLDRLEAEANERFERVEVARENSPLPDDVDWNRLNDLCIEVVRVGLGT